MRKKHQPGCPCCGGLFDFYGNAYSGDQDGYVNSELFLTPAVYPEGVTRPWTSLDVDPPIKIDYQQPADGTGSFWQTVCPLSTAKEIIWAIRGGSSQHPQPGGTRDVAAFDWGKQNRERLWFPEAVAPFANRGGTPLTEHWLVVSAEHCQTKAAQIAGTDYFGNAYEWGPEERLQTYQNGNCSLRRLACNESKIGFLYTDPSPSYFVIPDPVDSGIVEYDIVSGVATFPGAADRWLERVYPISCNYVWGNTWNDPDNPQPVDPSERNSGTNYPIICGVCPRDWPTVFSLEQPKFVFRGLDGPNSVDRAWTEYETHVARIRVGPWQTASTQVVQEGWPPDVCTDANTNWEALPILYGSGAEFWSDSWGQYRQHFQTAELAGEFGPYYWRYDSWTQPHCWANLLECDSAEGGSVAAAIFLHGRATIQHSVAPPYEWFADNPSGDPRPDETLDFADTFIKVKIGSGIVLDKPLYYDTNAGLGAGQLKPWARGLMVCQIPSDGIRRVIWFEALWQYEPVDGDSGTRSGWRLHCADASNGADIWTIDSDYPDSFPWCYASSNRFIYVRQFRLPDARMVNDYADDWVISHEADANSKPEWMWPARQIVDGFVDDNIGIRQPANDYPDTFEMDSFKNTGINVHSPTRREWDNRTEP